jgi:5-methylcytosine-specific restriction endonuclease McrA
MVFKRDNYTCQTCGIKNGQGKTIYLEPHHIKPFCVIFEEFLSSYKQYTIENDKEILVQLANDYKPFWDITNGKTLCKECHDKTKLGRNTMKGKWA